MAGLYFEERLPGLKIGHPIKRSVTEMDNVLFSGLTYDPRTLHIDFDFDFAAKSEWGRPLVDSMFSPGLMIGLSVGETTLGTEIGTLGMTDVTFPAPSSTVTRFGWKRRWCRRARPSRAVTPVSPGSIPVPSSRTGRSSRVSSSILHDASAH